MRKTTFVLSLSMIFLLIITSVYAHGHNFTETEELIDSDIGCNELSDEQFELIGGYYMEQMHPGEAHELMDEMMGGEGSDSLKQMHINMAKRLYCDEDVYGGTMKMMYYGMMNMMQGGRTMMYGMMGSWGLGYGLLYLIYLAIGAFIFSVIFWLTRNWLAKDKKRRRR